MRRKPKLEWSRAAREDLLAIVDDIGGNNPTAAQALKDEIETRAGALIDYPKRCAISKRAPGYRQLTVRRNYLVFYRLLPEDTPALIDVAAVAHARRQWP
jgi:toxin ParE1/3/4